MGNSSIDASVLSKTSTHSTCPWKGEASYYSITLDSESLSGVKISFHPNWRAETELKDAAWYYPEPKEKAKKIKDYVAFCERFQ